MKRKKKPEYYFQGNWNEDRIRIARRVAEFPLLPDGIRGPDKDNSIFDTSRIAFEIRSSPQMVNMIHLALKNGARIPTKAEIATAAAEGWEIPLNPYESRKTRVFHAPAEIKPEAPAAAIEKPPESAPASKPEAEPIPKEQMKADMDSFVEAVETGKAGLPEPPPPPPPPQRPPPPQTPAPPIINKDGNGHKEEKPLRPDVKEFRKSDAKAEPEIIEAKVDVKKEPLPKELKDKDKTILVGGDLFGNIQKVKLDMSTIFWYFYCRNVFGYEGSMEDFLNWSVADAIKSRGLSLEVVETQKAEARGGDDGTK